jgi:hypothetical protein
MSVANEMSSLRDRGMGLCKIVKSAVGSGTRAGIVDLRKAAIVYVSVTTSRAVQA